MPSNDGQSDAERVENALPPVYRMAERDGAELQRHGDSGEYRADHPHHATPSDHGQNICFAASGDTWHCKRHKHGSGGISWVAMREGIVDCSELEDGAIPSSLFGDALEAAADVAGIELDSAPAPSADFDYDEVTAADAERRALAGYYHEKLDEHGMRDQLKEWYGLSDELIDEQLIGYAPQVGPENDVPSVVGSLGRAVELGLCYESGRPVFHERFVFPYWVNHKGERRCRYFTGRTVHQDFEGPKYVKIAKDDVVADHAQVEPPFGIESVKGARKVVLTEGVTDVLSLHDHGIAAISPVTTSISDEMLDEFAKRLRGKEVYVVYDEDAGSEAGVQGAARDAYLLHERHVDAKVARLPAAPEESLDVNEYFMQMPGGEDDRRVRFVDEVIEDVTYPAPVAYWAWNSGDPYLLFEAAVEQLGHNPSMMKKRQDEDGDDYWVSVEEVLSNAKDLAHARRLFYQDGQVFWSSSDHKEAYYYVILWVMRTRGEFFKSQNTGEVYYFDESRKQMLKVSPGGRKSVNPEFSVRVRDLLGITPAKWSAGLFERVYEKVQQTAPERPMARLFYHDADEGEIYVNAHNGGYYALDGETVEWRPNGTDVFFADVDMADSWTYLPDGDRSELPGQIPGELSPFIGQGDAIHRFFCNRVNYDENAALAPALQRTQLYVHLHAFAFGSQFSAKPIMAWVGGKGSGKSVGVRAIGRWLYGEKFDESPMPTDADDFVAKVSNRTLCAIDNFDNDREWANDLLAAISTGSRIEMRQLYTTNDVASFKPQAWLAVTSRDPPFRRDDVADRTLVFRVERLESNVGEGAFLKQPLLYRDEIWSQYLDNINEILAYRNAQSDSHRETSHRMADWALFAEDAASVIDVPHIDEVLDGIQQERAFFALEDEPLRQIIDEWQSQNPAGGKFEAGELHDKFERAAERCGATYRYSHPRGLSNGLSSLSDELGQLYDMKIHQSKAGVKLYEFPGNAGQQVSHRTFQEEAE